MTKLICNKLLKLNVVLILSETWHADSLKNSCSVYITFNLNPVNHAIYKYLSMLIYLFNCSYIYIHPIIIQYHL